MSWFPKELEDRKAETAPGLISPIQTLYAIDSPSKRIQMDDVTFMIPYGTDSRERFENFISVLTWVLATTTAKIEIYISEAEDLSEGLEFLNLRTLLKSSTNVGYILPSDIQTVKDSIFSNICEYRFQASELKTALNIDIRNLPDFKNEVLSRMEITAEVRQKDQPFHRTRYLNVMLNKVTTPIVINHDADVILTKEGLISSCELLRRVNQIDCVYPYGHGDDYQIRMYNKNTTAVNEAVITGQVYKLIASNPGLGWMKWAAAYGHSIFFRTSSYKKMLGENENFISWGAEDVERYVRMVHMDFSISRVWAHVLHLEHPRGPDSGNSNPHFQGNEMLWEGLQKMSKDELLEYYKSVKYCHKYGWKI